MRQFHMNRAVLEIVSSTAFCNVTLRVDRGKNSLEGKKC